MPKENKKGRGCVRFLLSLQELLEIMALDPKVPVAGEGEKGLRNWTGKVQEAKEGKDKLRAEELQYSSLS